MRLPGRYGHAVVAILPVARCARGVRATPATSTNAQKSRATVRNRTIALMCLEQADDKEHEANRAEPAAERKEEPCSGERGNRDQHDRNLEHRRRDLQG